MIKMMKTVKQKMRRKKKIKKYKMRINYNTRNLSNFKNKD